MATEKLKFKIELYATMWDKPPYTEILIDNHLKFKGYVIETEGKPKTIEFDHEFKENGNYNLVIRYLGKQKTQTVVDKNGRMIKDQLLHIKSIEVDEVNIGPIVYHGIYTPKYPEPWATEQRQAGNELHKSFKNVTKMGHNGTWVLNFSSPFYMWLLENLY